MSEAASGTRRGSVALASSDAGDGDGGRPGGRRRRAAGNCGMHCRAHEVTTGAMPRSIT